MSSAQVLAFSYATEKDTVRTEMAELMAVRPGWISSCCWNRGRTLEAGKRGRRPAITRSSLQRPRLQLLYSPMALTL